MRKAILFVAALAGLLAVFTTPASARELARTQPTSPAAALQVRQTEAAASEFVADTTGPTNEQIASGVLKVLGALVLHEQSKPQPDDEVLDTVGRGIAKAARDKLIESSLADLFPNSRAVERAAVRNLVILALDGRLTRDRDKVIAYLRKTNPDMADVVEVAEFLIQVGQAVEKNRK